MITLLHTLIDRICECLKRVLSLSEGYTTTTTFVVSYNNTWTHFQQAVGGECTWWEGGGGIKSGMQLIVEYICEVLVDLHKLFPCIEGQDIVCGVKGCGSIRYVCKKAACWEGNSCPLVL